MDIPAGTIVNADVRADAEIAASKIVRQHVKTYAIESDTAVTDTTYTVHTVYGTTGVILGFKCGCVVPSTGTDVLDVDLLINGATCLTAVVRVDKDDAAYAIVSGTIDTSALADGDVVEIDFDVTAGDGTAPKGAFATVIFTELPA
jgi:hypothetical protein